MNCPWIPVITMDGPGASGKGTIAARLASHLGWHLLDSGSLYRAFAWGFMHDHLELIDASYKIVINRLQVDYSPRPLIPDMRIFYAGESINTVIRQEEWAKKASELAAIPAVREALLPLQQQARRAPGLVADGRDMGAVIFPDAVLKFYLEANAEERGKRRYKQLKQQGINVSLQTVCQELAQRDYRDQHRLVSPAEPSEDMILIDTSNLSIEQVLMQMIETIGCNRSQYNL